MALPLLLKKQLSRKIQYLKTFIVYFFSFFFSILSVIALGDATYRQRYPSLDFVNCNVPHQNLLCKMLDFNPGLSCELQ